MTNLGIKVEHGKIVQRDQGSMGNISVDAHYLLLTTRELPKCSALGYGLDQVQTLQF